MRCNGPKGTCVIGAGRAGSCVSAYVTSPVHFAPGGTVDAPGGTVDAPWTDQSSSANSITTLPVIPLEVSMIGQNVFTFRKLWLHISKTVWFYTEVCFKIMKNVKSMYVEKVVPVILYFFHVATINAAGFKVKPQRLWWKQTPVSAVKPN